MSLTTEIKLLRRRVQGRVCRESAVRCRGVLCSAQVESSEVERGPRGTPTSDARRRDERSLVALGGRWWWVCSLLSGRLDPSQNSHNKCYNNNIQ